MLLTKLTLNNNVKLDFFHLEESSSANVDIFNINQYKPILNNYSRFLVTFDNGNTIAEGVADVALGYTFSVYRELKDTNELYYVAKLENGGLSVTDYNVINNTLYRYYIFKEDESAISEAVVSNDVTTCWWDWSIIDIIPSTTEDGLYYATGNLWKLGLNLTSGTREQNVNNTVYDNLTKYPVVSYGKLNYSFGSLPAILGTVQKTSNSLAEYVEANDLLDKWNDFCANGNLKLLKDRKGSSKIVAITGTSSQVDDVTREQANSVTFNWVEVEDVNNITIIGDNNGKL